MKFKSQIQTVCSLNPYTYKVDFVTGYMTLMLTASVYALCILNMMDVYVEMPPCPVDPQHLFSFFAFVEPRAPQ